jgi:hypothetical protein
VREPRNQGIDPGARAQCVYRLSGRSEMRDEHGSNTDAPISPGDVTFYRGIKPMYPLSEGMGTKNGRPPSPRRSCLNEVRFFSCVEHEANTCTITLYHIPSRLTRWSAQMTRKDDPSRRQNRATGRRLHYDSMRRGVHQSRW